MCTCWGEGGFRTDAEVRMTGHESKLKRKESTEPPQIISSPSFVQSHCLSHSTEDHSKSKLTVGSSNFNRFTVQRVSFQQPIFLVSKVKCCKRITQVAWELQKPGPEY